MSAEVQTAPTGNGPATESPLMAAGMAGVGFPPGNINTSIGPNDSVSQADDGLMTPLSAAPSSATTQLTNASLYVGELDRNVTEAMLFELFSSVGQVASIRVCRDAVSRQSLGYAYVNYNNAADAAKALEDLNYTVIQSKSIRIMNSHRDPALRKTGDGNVFIKNLDAAIDNKTLHDTFINFGNILSCKIAMDEHGASRGYGFIHFEKAENAKEAIKSVNGMLLNDKKVFVGLHVPKRERQSKYNTMKTNFTNIFVKNIEPGVTDEQFDDLFSRYGKITSATIARDDEGKSHGFGFVNYETHEHAEAAVEALNESELHGQQIYVGRAQKKFEREEELRKKHEAARTKLEEKYAGVNLFIKNLADELDDEKLREIFSRFGTVTSARVMRDINPASPTLGGTPVQEKENIPLEKKEEGSEEDKKEDAIKPEKKSGPQLGKSKGFGFVCFSEPSDATKAVNEMNGKMTHGKPLYVAIAQKKEARKSQLAASIEARSQVRMAQQATQNAMPPGYQQPMYYGAQQPSYMQNRAGMPYGMGPIVSQPTRAGSYTGAFPGQNGSQGRGMQAASQMGANMYGMPAGYPSAMAGNQAFYTQQQQQQAQMQAIMAQTQALNLGGRVGGPIGRDGNAGMRGMPSNFKNMPGQMIGMNNYNVAANGRGGSGMGPTVVPGAANMGGYAGQMGNNRGGPMMIPGGMPGGLGAGGPNIGQNARAPAMPQGSGNSLLAQLQAMPPNQQKQSIGEALFPKIQAKQHELAPKITGMLLEMQIPDLLTL